MKMFKCVLVDRGYQKELFFREGDSASSVKQNLEMFQWPKGTWRIEELEDEEGHE